MSPEVRLALIQTNDFTIVATNRVAAVANEFDLRDVTLLDGLFKDAQLRDEKYILRFTLDGLLYWFRQNNGLPAPGKPYGAWWPDRYEQQGHFQGHYLSACAQMYRNTGDVRFKDRGDALVAGLAECQRTNGFLATFPEKNIFVLAGLEKSGGEKKLPQPWYCLHKIYAGLLDMYQLAGNHQALAVLERSAAWIQTISDRLSDEQFQKMLDLEHGGMNEVLANLYAATGKPQYLWLAERFNHHKVMEPFLRGADPLDGLHANTQIPKFVGLAREYELTADPDDLTIARGFWERVAHERSYVTGGNSDHEHFGLKAKFSEYLSPETTETCNSYNMLKLTRHLFGDEPRAEFFDYFERVQLNHILSSQNPETTMVLYFQNLLSGNAKATYSSPAGSMACCHGSGMENHAKYADSIYWHDGGNGLWVNLFIASELNWRAQGVKVRQETKFPDAGSTKLTFHCAKPAEITLRLRRPFWAVDGFGVRVNGKEQAVVAAPGSYAEIKRVWADGDVVEVALPMRFRFESFADNTNRMALMFGPLVMCAKTEAGDRVSVLTASPAAAIEALRSVAGKSLEFTAPANIFCRSIFPPAAGAVSEFKPLLRENDNPYAVYWDEVGAGFFDEMAKTWNAELQRQRELAPRTVDLIFPRAGTAAGLGSPQGQFSHAPGLEICATNRTSEAAHQLTFAERANELLDISVGGIPFATRHTLMGKGRWFSYEFNVAPDAEQSLLLRLVVCEPASRWRWETVQHCGFDIFAGDRKLQTVTLPKNVPAGFYEVTIPLPRELTGGKQKLALKFSATGNETVAPIAEFRVVKQNSVAAPAAKISGADAVPVRADAVIYGATPAGITAAVAADRAGVSVILLEHGEHIGGMMASGLGATDVGDRTTIGGLSHEVFARISAKYQLTNIFHFEPHVAAEVFQEMLGETKVRVFTGHTVDSVERDHARITLLRCIDGSVFAAKTFVDATYEGDLLALAGVHYTIGREARSAYGESLAGIQDVHQLDHVLDATNLVKQFHRAAGYSSLMKPSISWYQARVGYLNSHQWPVAVDGRDGHGQPLVGVTAEPLGTPGAGDRRFMAYNYRLCLTQNETNRIAIMPPENYRAADYELLARYLQKWPDVKFSQLFYVPHLQNQTTDLNTSGPYSSDLLDGSAWDYPEANWPKRDQIAAHHRDFLQGMLWFLGNDLRVPPALRAEARSWGLDRREFADNGFWPWQLYVRVARRMVGEYVMTQHDVLEKKQKPDAIAIGSFIMDSHNIRRVLTPEGFVLNEGGIEVPTKGPYEIPYRSLTPRAAECENLLVPVCLSASYIAYCSIRMEPVYMMLGQSAGAAAAVAAQKNYAVQKMPYDELQTRLAAQGQNVLKIK